jgi:chromosome segregation ATPase
MSEERQYSGGPQDPENKLEELKQTLNKKKGEANSLTQEMGVLSEDIAALDQVTKEVKQILDSFGQAFKNLKYDKEDVSDYLTQKKPKIEAEIRDKKGIIDETIKKLKKDIDDAGKALKDLDDAHEKAKVAYENAKKDAEEALAYYNSSKTSQKSIEDRLKELKSLREKIEKEDNRAAKYFLLGELEETLAKLNDMWIDSQEDLKKRLYAAWTASYSKKEDLRKEKEKWETAKKTVEDQRKELEQLEKERVTKTLKALSAL